MRTKTRGWSNRQKGDVHVYAETAGLIVGANKHRYQRLMVILTGTNSAASPALTQRHFDIVMPALEALAHQSVMMGETRHPRQIDDWWKWRNKVVARGMMTSRQHYRIQELWAKLAPTLPPERQGVGYLLAMVAQGTTAAASLAGLTEWQAGALVAALYDRLARAGVAVAEEA